MTELSLIAKATVILSVSLVATRFTRNGRASVRSLILASAFGLVLIVPLASAVAPPRELRIPDDYAPPFLLEGVRSSSSTSDSPAPLLNAPAPPESSLPSVASLARAAWLLGALASVAPLLLGLWRLRDVRTGSRGWVEGRAIADGLRASLGVRRAVDVVISDALLAPMTCGSLRPMIAMPADASNWSAAEIRQALLHELEHVRRHDWSIHLLARLTCALYWFHPLIWTTWRQLRVEAERACDDAVLGEADGAAYAQQLVTLARRLHKGTAVPCCRWLTAAP
jgi:beta-lactamase regulating signal transducer with metallopeptidase domain